MHPVIPNIAAQAREKPKIRAFTYPPGAHRGARDKDNHRRLDESTQLGHLLGEQQKIGMAAKAASLREVTPTARRSSEDRSSQSVAASSSLIPRLQRANDQRNDLAHQYFWDRAIQFASSDGQAEMIAELKQMEAEFTSLDDDLGEIVNSLIRDRGQDIDSFHSRVEASLNAFLSGAQIPHNSESVPNPVEVMAAQVWRVNSDEPGNLVLISSEGRHLVPGERGICYGPPSVPPGMTARTLSFDKAFPAQINPRPKTTAPWNYGIPLANGHVLRAETKPDLAPGQFRVWIQRPRRP